MKKSVWDLFAPVYERAMKSQKNIYESIYQNIRLVVDGKSEVLKGRIDLLYAECKRK